MTHETPFAITWTSRDGGKEVSTFCAHTADTARANAERTLRRNERFAAIISVKPAAF